MRIKERIQKLEKKLIPYQDTKNYRIVFVGKNSDGSWENIGHNLLC